MCAHALIGSSAWFVPISGDEVFDGPLKEIQQRLDTMHNSLSEWNSRYSKKPRSTNGGELLDTENQPKNSDEPDKHDGLTRPWYGSVRQVLSVMPVSLQV